MKLSCLQEHLARGLSIVNRAVASRASTLPVLTHVLLATDNGRLRICATNLDLGINCWIGAKVESEGAIAVPARTFGDLVALLSEELVPGAEHPHTDVARAMRAHRRQHQRY